MDKKIFSIIQKIYIQKNFHLYKEKCNKKLDFLEEILESTKELYKEVYCARHDEPLDPSVIINFEFLDYKNDSVCFSFSSICRISKLANVYYINHEFSMDNPVENWIDPTLDGFGYEPYIKEQKEMEKRIDAILVVKGYHKICSDEDLYEAIYGVEVPENMLFGNQMTMYTALFEDTWDIESLLKN